MNSSLLLLLSAAAVVVEGLLLLPVTVDHVGVDDAAVLVDGGAEEVLDGAPLLDVHGGGDDERVPGGHTPRAGLVPL